MQTNATTETARTIAKAQIARIGRIAEKEQAAGTYTTEKALRLARLSIAVLFWVRSVETSAFIRLASRPPVPKFKPGIVSRHHGPAVVSECGTEIHAIETADAPLFPAFKVEKHTDRALGPDEVRIFGKIVKLPAHLWEKGGRSL